VELNHLTVPVVMMNPFIAILDDGNARALPIGDDDDFEGKVRSGRGAKRAITKAQQAISTGIFISYLDHRVNFWFWQMRFQLLVAFMTDAIQRPDYEMWFASSAI
jgi:hypothetical protein